MAKVIADYDYIYNVIDYDYNASGYDDYDYLISRNRLQLITITDYDNPLIHFVHYTLYIISIGLQCTRC